MVKCPNCGAVSTDKDFNEGTEKCGVRLDDRGFNQYECWECNHEWEEKFGE